MSERLGGARYELGPRIGYGGMATVYSARDLKLDRQVAVKLLADNYSGDEEIRKRFMREARLAAKLDHPNVVQVFDVGEDDDGRPYIVMEEVEGDTLGERLLRYRGALSEREALRLLSQLCDGLGHAHDRRLVHRDIKPGNLLLRDSDGCLKIADFGIARAAEDTRLTRPGRVIGTDRYMAPEQIADGKITPATDIWACGIVADEVLPANRPAEVQEIVDRCLNENPADRYRDAGELGAALGHVDGNGTAIPLRHIRTQTRTTERTAPTRMRPPTSAVRPRRGRGARWAAGAGIIALVGVVAVLVLGSGGSGDSSGGTSAVQRSPARPTVVPSSDDPATQARELADFLRAQSR